MTCAKLPNFMNFFPLVNVTFTQLIGTGHCYLLSCVLMVPLTLLVKTSPVHAPKGRGATHRHSFFLDPEG